MAGPKVLIVGNNQSLWVDQNLPPPGKHFDEVGGTCYRSGNAEKLAILNRAGGRKASLEIVEINKRIIPYFKCREYFLAIELLGTEPHWVIRWRETELLRRPIKLMAFDPQNPPFIKNGFVVFKVGDHKINVIDHEHWQEVKLVRGKELQWHGGGRALAIPLNRHEVYVNQEQIIKGFADLILRKSADDNLVKRADVTKLDQAGAIYQIDVMPAKVEVPQKERDNKFVDKVVKTIMGDDPHLREFVEVVIPIDTSGSMEPGAALILRNVIDIVKALKEEGAISVKIGVIEFHDPDYIKTVLPLTEMDEGGIIKLLDLVGNIEFAGGCEPVGEAVMEGIKQLLKTDGPIAKAVVPITDDDGLGDDKMARPFFEDAEREGRRKGINVGLENIYEQEKEEPLSYPLPVIAQVEKYHLNGNYSGLIALATLSDNYFVRYHARKALKDLGLLVEDRIKKPPQRFAKEEGEESPCTDIHCKVAEALSNGEFSDEYMTTMSEISEALKEEMGAFASNYISYFLIHLVKNNESRRLKVMADTLAGIYKASDNRGGVIFEPLHLFAPAMTNMADFKKYHSLVKSVVTGTDVNTAKIVVALLNNYAAWGHGFGDLKKYADFLIAHKREVVRRIGEKKYRLLPELVVNAPGLNYFALLNSDEAVKQMANLFLETRKPHSWLQIETGQSSAFISADEGEGKIDASGIEKLVQTVRCNPSTNGELTFYMIDPEMKTSGLTQRFISPEKIAQVFGILHRLGRRGIIMDLRIVTPAGMYSVKPTRNMTNLRPEEIEGTVKKIVDRYKKWMEKRGPLVEAEVMDGLESNGYMTVDYSYHHVRITEVVKLYKQWLKIKEELLKERKKMRPKQSLKFYSRLKEHYPRFKNAVDEILKESARLPGMLTEFYKGVLREEMKYLKALGALHED